MRNLAKMTGGRKSAYNVTDVPRLRVSSHSVHGTLIDRDTDQWWTSGIL